MSAHMLNSSIQSARKPQLARALVVPHARRHRLRKGAFGMRGCGPSLMALSPLDAFFDLSPTHLLETEDFVGLERARPMAVDFVEDRNGFQIKADVPGVAKEDIKLDVDHNVITISAKKSSSNSTEQETADDKDTQAAEGGSTTEVVDSESEDKILHNDANVLRYERYDLFQSRSFRVPRTADLKTISAKYVDGVLTVDIKKREDVLDVKRTVDIE